ncbi:hypothetical protein [Parasitella parasitica]|uniref:Tc1-like transposase DDE domain-containing protein n=1 Tax=Parasitella parasitica TaxID=35722 RepID=A0A0B7NM27_9FUNG|nr:hypothetical protein [Parasitella parasitica]
MLKYYKSISKKKKKQNVEKKISDGEVGAKAKGNRVSDEIKARAVHLVDVHPKNSARAVALDLKLEPRTVQRWYKAWKEDPDSLFKVIGRPKIIEPEGELAEATKQVVSDFYFKQPTSTMDQLMEQLNTSFGNLAISKRTLYRYMADLWLFSLKRIRLEPEDRNSPEKIQQRKEWVIAAQVVGVDYLKNSVFIDEAGFNANLRRTQGWAPIGETPIVTVKTARANSISILGAISSKGLIKVCLRKPVPPPSSKKRKLTGTTKKQTKGTNTNHYANFVSDILAEMDKFPEMKGHFLIMGNAPIHTNKIIRTMIEERGYRCLYLPSYSPELNPIEQFWSVVKSGVKREFVLKKDTLPQVITTACNEVLVSSFEGFARYSVNRFADCLEGQPI